MVVLGRGDFFVVLNYLINDQYMFYTHQKWNFEIIWKCLAPSIINIVILSFVRTYSCIKNISFRIKKKTNSSIRFPNIHGEFIPH